MDERVVYTISMSTNVGGQVPIFLDSVEVELNISGKIVEAAIGDSTATFSFAGRIPTIHLYADPSQLNGNRPGAVDGVEADLAENSVGCTAGSVAANLGSLDVTIHAGTEDFRLPQTMRIEGEVPSADFARVAGLEIDDELIKTYDANGNLTQLDGDKAAIVLQTIDSHQYKLSFFHKDNAGSPTQFPHSSVVIKNPDGASSLNRLHVSRNLHEVIDVNGQDQDAITKTETSKYTYSPTTESWTLETETTTSPGGTNPTTTSGKRIESLTKSTAVIPDGNQVDQTFETETRTVTDASGGVISKTSSTYWLAPFGRVMTSQIIDPDGRALTTSYDYYTDANSDGESYGQRRSTTSPTGDWVHFSYDSFGRLAKRVSPVLDPAITADQYDGSQDATLRVTTTIYDDTPAGNSPHETIVETYLGTEVSRRYVRYHSDGEDRYTCQTPGAPFGAADNLVTKSRNLVGGDFDREPVSIHYPDGTATLYQHALISGDTQRQVTMSTGKLSPDGSTIVDGTRTTTVSTRNGGTLSTLTEDILSSNELSRTTNALDEFGRPTTTSFRYPDMGTFATSTTNYDCCGIANSTDRSGVYTEYDNTIDLVSTQTSLGVRSTSTVSADARPGGGRIETSTRTAVDNSGNEIANTNTVLQRREYDVAGDLVKEYAPPVNADTDPIPTDLAARRATIYAETIDPASGHRTRTVTNPDNSTVVTEYYADGSLLKITGSGTHHSRFEYGVEVPAGTSLPAMRFTKTILLKNDGTDSSEWSKSYTDFAGRNTLSVTSSSATTSSTFNQKGQLVAQNDPDGVATLYAYDDRGRTEIAAEDLDRDGVIDYDGTDRITKTTSSVAQRDGKTTRLTTTDAWIIDGDATTTAELSRFESSTDGLQTWSSSDGLETHTSMAYAGNGNSVSTTTNPDNTRVENITIGGRLKSVTQFDNTNTQITSTTYDYDALGRATTVTDARNGATTINYYIDDRVKSTTTPDPDGAGPELPRTTSLTYDIAGRRHTTTLPDHTVAAPKLVTYNYHPTGELQGSSGARSYTTSQTYDFAGRMKTLTAGTGTTTWNYFSTSGYLQSKLYADGNGTSYTYTQAGRQQTRTLARGAHRKTSYGNDGLPQSIAYFTDNTETTPDPLTPGTSFTYDRVGNVKTLSDDAGLHTFTTTPTGRTELEIISGGLLDGATLDPSYDALLRRHTLSFAALGATSLTHSYRYDEAGRYAKIATGADSESSPSATYTYHSDSHLPDTTTSKTATGATRLTLTRNFDALNRLTSLTNQAAGPTLPLNTGYTFDHNAAAQREKITLADGSYWQYAYDQYGQLETATKHLQNGSPIASQTHTFTHDNIGNRNGSGGVLPASSNYTPNNLNQYTQVTHTGTHWVTGQADPAATVTVNGNTATRPGAGAYFEHQTTADNTSGPAYVDHTIESNLDPNQDLLTRRATIPAASVVPQHDADGNLTSDSLHTYTWDGENRLISIETRADSLPVSYPHQRLEFAYDSGSRRIDKKVYGKIAGNWELARHKRFLYDGWNLLAEYEPKDLTTWHPTLSYLWGNDLSGTMRGAGGTSGLLHIRHHHSEQGYFVAYDGNGNVSALINEQTGDTSATYSYSPFGQTAKSNGPAAHLNPFRFSTRYHDTETRLYYYGYRYYNPKDGRWLNRDPLGESGGVNLYGFVGSDPVNSVDFLGLALYAFDGTKNDFDQQTHIGMLTKYYQGNREYMPGVGRDAPGVNESGYDKLLGRAGGLGGKARVELMYDRFVTNYRNGDRIVDIIGFSRGAALALDFANKLHEEGYPTFSAIIEPDPKRVGRTVCRKFRTNREPVTIRYMGLFDVVGSFGVGGNDWNIGYNLSLPPNVQHAAHAVAGDELRPLFPLTRLGGIANEVAFNGDHSDIGGGHRNDTGILSRKPLFFIINEGKKVGVPFGKVQERDYIINLRPHNLSRNLDWVGLNIVSGQNWLFGRGNSRRRTNLPPFDQTPIILP